jgi:autotransporter-associated beta strand protein
MKPAKNNRLIAGLRNGRNLLGLGAVLLTGTVANAATAYWDTNYTTAGSGNTGSSWEGVNWTTDSTGSSETVIWNDGDSAVFSAGTDGNGSWTVTLGSTITAPSITFAQTGSKTISGGTINIGGGTINSTALGFAPGNGDDININSVLAGTGGLTIAGHGDATSNGGGGGGAEFRLGANNTFSGGLTITSGLVSWNTDANLGDPSNVITLNGGGLLYTDNTLTTARNIEIGANGGTIRLYGGKTLTLDGLITNASGVANATLRRTDGGTVKLNASGAGFIGTYINGANSTQLSAPNADWSNTDFVISGGNFNPNGTGTAVVNSINSTADVIIDNGTTLDVDTGAITLLTAHWYKTNVGALGMLTSSSGTLTITNGAATGDLTTTDHQINVKLVDSGATPLALVKNNNNQLVLNQANTYSGGTTVNGGRLQPNNAASLGTGAVTINSGAQVFLTASPPYANSFTINGDGITEGAQSLGALRFANSAIVTGAINLASASRITVNNGNEIGTVAGALTGSSALEKTGAGALVISGSAAGYTGAITVSGGTLKLDNALGGSLAMNDATILAGEGSISGGLTIGAASGSDLRVNGATPEALSTTNLTVNGLTYVRLTSLPAVQGSPISVVNYSGTLTIPGDLKDSFQLVDDLSYRGAPTFANTGTAITLTIPAGANLVWRGDDATNPSFWDTNVTANWANTPTNPDVFFAGDHVVFDDTAIGKTVAMQGFLSPATVTFNNSTGNDYSLTGNAATIGFTGPTSIVKNGTGTVTMQGYGHSYTGTVTINAGILQADGNYELLGNSSGVTINNGGQLNINGANFGDRGRHYNVTIAGAGANGLGAITNTSGNSPNENAGFLHLTLSDNASVGTTGGRYDIGKSGGSFGSITGNGFTLTKVGSGTVCMRAPAPNITYVIDAGTLKFENSNIATGPNAIAVNAGTLQAYGNLTFGNVLNFAAGTTLDNDGGGSQTWTGPLNLTDTVNLNARNGGITLSGVISGDASVNANGGGTNSLTLSGSASNTYTGNTTVGNTGQLVLSKTGGAVAVPGDLVMAATGTRVIVSASQDNQFGPSSVLRYTGSADNRLELKGTTQTIAGIDNTSATPGYNCIQHSEFGSPAAVDESSDLIVNVAESNFYTYSGVLRDQGGLVNLTKAGAGTQTLLGGLIDFTGTTTVTAGRLIVNSDDSHTAVINISAGAFWEANVTSTTDTFENRRPNFTLTGAGTYVKSGAGNLSMGWDGGASVAMASGALIDITEGTIRLEYGALTTWTNNKSDLSINFGAALDLWDNNNDGVFVDSLNGGGSVVRTRNGTGNITVGVDNGSGDFSGTISNATGRTNLIKVGSGTQTLSGTNTYSGDTTVSGGTLALSESGSLSFYVTNATSNRIDGTGTVTIAGDFYIDTTAVTAYNGTWNLVNTTGLTTTFDSTFSPGTGWTETANIWELEVGDKVWTFSEATGELKLTSTNTYASWIDGFFPGITNPATIGANADPDHDGISNALELVFGGNPATGMDTALLPTLELVTDPAGVPAGNYLLFTYRRTDLSASAGVVAGCQYDADLAGSWSLAQNGVDGVVILEDDNYASFTPPATNTDRVRVFVPRGTNPVLFGRLRATIP